MNTSIMNQSLKLGFTGTQKRTTFKQYESLDYLLKFWQPWINEYHHGDCQGSDDEFHHWILLSAWKMKIVIHPSDNPAKRAFCKFSGNLEMRPEKPYLERDWDIASECDFLIATPREQQEVLRSGTWTTIRYAKKLHKPVYIIFPDGEIVKCGNWMNMTSSSLNLF